jgi:glyoxylase-like metal-dependent hydrolase (beta-lactamase superfamily II)
MTNGVPSPAVVARDLWRISTPLPFRPREVHAYLARLEDGEWMLVDGGLATDEAWAALERGVGEAAGGWSAISLHVLTHMHVDHVGLAARVVAASGARVAMGALDARRMAHAAAEPGEEAAYRAELMRRAGVPEDVFRALEAGRREAAPPPVRVDDELAGELGGVPGAAGWRWVWTPGHTAGHVVLFRPADRVLVSGDAILPKVVPTVGVNRQRDDPVGDVLAMLDRVDALGSSLVAGGHGDPIADPAARIAELRAGYAGEGDAFLALLGPEPATAWTLAERRRPGRELPAGVRVQLVREALAHLGRLAAVGLAAEVPMPGAAAGWVAAAAAPRT